MAIDFFFDLVSPYSYLASGLVGAIGERHDVPVRWRPVFLGGILKATGNPTPALVPAKVRHMVKDLERCARHYRLGFAMPDTFPINTLLALRILCQLPEQEVPDMARKLFRRYWVEGVDISDPSVLANDLSPEMISAGQSQSARDRLKHHSDEAVRQGAFGVPSFVVDDELFFGHDRLSLLDAYLRERGRHV